MLHSEETSDEQSLAASVFVFSALRPGQAKMAISFYTHTHTHKK